jgi:hypothetical protein
MQAPRPGPRRSQSGHPAELWPLAEAKLAAPRQRAGLVDRPRILRALSQTLGTALVAIPAVALGILVGTMVVRAVRIAMRTHIVKRRPSLPRP